MLSVIIVIVIVLSELMLSVFYAECCVCVSLYWVVSMAILIVVMVSVHIQDVFILSVSFLYEAQTFIIILS
jgi:hypothetical protein